MSVAIEIDLKVSKKLARAMSRLSRMNTRDLLDQVGNMVANQTKFRLQKEKTDPDGHAWPEWSEDYAKTRHGNQSLLISSGALQGSIEHELQSNQVDVGSNLKYAATHQFGRGGIPARPYLGVSRANAEDIDAMMEDWFEDLFGVPL